MRIAPGRHRIAEKILRAKHVVAAGWLTWDAGSIPAASTILRPELRFRAEDGALHSSAFGSGGGPMRHLFPGYGWRTILGNFFILMYYAYILESETTPGEFYRGHTDGLKRRVTEHNAGKCTHTSKLRPWKVKFYAAFETLALAQEFERYLKSGSGHAFAKRHLFHGQR